MHVYMVSAICTTLEDVSMNQTAQAYKALSLPTAQFPTETSKQTKIEG